MLDHDDISLIIPNINNNIINVYINICYGNRNVLKILNYEQLIDLLILLDMYPLKNLKIEELEYYIYTKYTKNSMYDEFLKDICQTYELRYLTSKLYNFPND